MIEIIRPHFDDVVFTRFMGNPRSRPPEELLSIAAELHNDSRPATRCHVAQNPETAVLHARELAGQAGLVVVTGSIFLASEVRSLLT